MAKFRVTLRAEDIVEVEAENESEAIERAYQETDYPGVRWLYVDAEEM